MRLAGTAFEVRCKRCNVTFPIETRTCIHCGGTIDPHDTTDTSLMPANASMGGRDDADTFAQPVDVMSDPFEAEASEAPPSVGSSIIRSLGGFIWVIVLIGFTIARSCGSGE